jgi:CheY-like chemotaxis protein
VKEKTIQTSIFPGNTNDQATTTDDLGFRPYVMALAQFLTNKNTMPPIVLSIEGEWGSGKSSFMLQLEKVLYEVRKKASYSGIIGFIKIFFRPWKWRQKPLSLWFNAWRHDQEEALWATFALQFIRQISSQRFFLRRWWGHLLLFLKRFSWSDGWIDLLRIIFFIAIVFGIVVSIPIFAYLKKSDLILEVSNLSKWLSDKETWQDIIKWGIGAGGFTAYAALILSLLLKFKKFFGNPLEIDLKQYIQSPDYEERVSFIERFHEDFKFIVNAYAGNHTVFVFIDDLDRCEVPKAAELMTALNLMISKDPRLVFIIGMDREKIAAGLAVKHEKLLPYLYTTQYLLDSSGSKISDATKNITDNVIFGLHFGYEFIEKFIQLPFLVPRPREDDISELLDKLSTARVQQVRRWNLKRIFKPRWLFQKKESKKEKMHDEDQGDAEFDPEVTIKNHRETIKLQVGEDSNQIREIVLVASTAMDNNPRRIKQFLNLYRLRTYIAAETGLFDSPEDPDKQALTLEQLGKFVAINLKWPLLLPDLENDSKLLSKLQAFAINPDEQDKKSNAFARWKSQGDLIRFLRIQCLDDLGKPDPEEHKWSLSELDVDKLLQVSPRVRFIGLRPSTTTEEDQQPAVDFADLETALKAAIEFRKEFSEGLAKVSRKDKKQAIDQVKIHFETLNGAKILWVDDHPENNKNEKLMFMQLGAEINTAVQSTEAFEKLESNSYNLIISDILRDDPDDLNGIDFLSKLHNIGYSTPLIFYIGNLDPGMGVPKHAFGITNRPDKLIHLVIDALGRQSVKEST